MPLQLRDEIRSGHKLILSLLMIYHRLINELDEEKSGSDGLQDECD